MSHLLARCRRWFPNVTWELNRDTQAQGSYDYLTLIIEHTEGRREPWSGRISDYSRDGWQLKAESWPKLVVKLKRCLRMIARVHRDAAAGPAEVEEVSWLRNLMGALKPGNQGLGIRIFKTVVTFKGLAS